MRKLPENNKEMQAISDFKVGPLVELVTLSGGNI